MPGEERVGAAGQVRCVGDKTEVNQLYFTEFVMGSNKANVQNIQCSKYHLNPGLNKLKLELELTM